MKTITYRFKKRIAENGVFSRPYLLSINHAQGVSSPMALRELVRELQFSGADIPPVKLNRFYLPPCVEVVRDRGFVVDFLMTLAIPERGALSSKLKPLEEPYAIKTISRSRYHRIANYLIGDDFVVQGEWYRRGSTPIAWQYGDPVPAIPISGQRSPRDASRINSKFVFNPRMRA